MIYALIQEVSHIPWIYLINIMFCFFLKDEISEVILMGGGTRTPMVQDQLLKATGR